MIKKPYFYIVLLLAFLLSGMRCGEAEKKSRPKDALVCINHECLTERDIEYQIPDAYRGAVTPEEKKEYVKRWIRNEIIYQEAKRQKVDQDKKVKSLVKQGIKDILVKEFIDQKLKDKLKVTEEEARRYYQQNRQQFAWEDDYVRISHIFIQGMSGATLADLLLKEGNKFEDIALKMSEDETTKKKGGDLGFVRTQDLSPEIAEFASKLKEEEISPPIQTSYGYEIIRVTDRRQKGSHKGFQWAKEEIINSLTLQYRQREIENILEQLGEKVEIETFDWASDITPLETK
jgi:peptidyl-prolyl cis-trans isomerase C